MLAEEGHSVPLTTQVDFSKLTGEHECNLMKQIARLPEEIRAAARDYDPSKINRYALELAASFHSFYSHCRMRGEEETLLKARLKLAEITRQTIACCLDILGISAPEKM